MNALMIVALVLAIPIVVIPVAFIWYLNVGGMVAAAKEARAKKAARELAQKVQA